MASVTRSELLNGAELSALEDSPNSILLDMSEQLSDPTKACRQFDVFIQGSTLMKIFQRNTTNSKIETNQSSSLKMRTVAHSYLYSIVNMSVNNFFLLLHRAF